MRLTERVHQLLEDLIRPGDLCIDATAGNGHDTLKLAQLVGSTGKVIALDLQTEAITATRQRLEANGQSETCTLIEGDHSQIMPQLLEDHAAQARAITFNLGYLPGGDKAKTTTETTTQRALEASASLTATGGTLFVTAYRGHPGGQQEAASVEAWMRALPNKDWTIESFEPTLAQSDRIPPILWTARKSPA